MKSAKYEPMQRQVESWRQTQITDARAKLIFYSAFVDSIAIVAMLHGRLSVWMQKKRKAQR